MSEKQRPDERGQKPKSRQARPIEKSHIQESYVRPPRFGFCGNIKLANYNFRFNESGKLYSVQRVWQEDEWKELRQTPVLIDTNTAYRTATQWLSSISLDIAGLERQPRHINQQRASTKKDDFCRSSTWDGARTGRSKSRSSSHGATGELLKLQWNDPSLSPRPVLENLSPGEEGPTNEQ